MKSLPALASSLLIIALLVTPVLATSDTSVSDLVGTTNTTTNTNTQPNLVASANTLALDIPTQTDNPSTIITFTNPSKDNAVIQLETDSKGFVDITSPYTFPALSIGKHTLEFKYQDENASTQLFDTSIIIIPRAPILSTPIIGTENVTISGTGLANSEIIVLLSSGSSVFTKTAVIDGNGKWDINFLKSDLTQDVYSLNAYTRRYGYASNLSEATKFTLDTNASSITRNISSFDINNITLDSVKGWVINNQNYLITAFAALLTGIMIGILSTSQKKQKNERKVERKVANEFVKTGPNGNEITLREKLMGIAKTVEPKVEDEEKEEEEVEGNIEAEKVMNKIDFLKDFKNFDPDDSKGKEHKSSVEVSLTSKK